MKIRYRIVQEANEVGNWETIGAITYWEAYPKHLQLSGIMQHTVSTPIWRTIQSRVEQNQLMLENYQEALVGFEAHYRILSPIYELEAESAAEIRRIIREKYVWANSSITAELVAA